MKKIFALFVLLSTVSFLSGCQDNSHYYQVEEKEATCEEDGYYREVCVYCGEVKQDTIVVYPAHGHKYIEHRHEDPTCTKTGTSEKICEYCGKTIIEDIDKANHDYELVEYKEATCTSGGYKLYKCKSCGEMITTDEEEPLDHDYEEIVVPPTCTEKGYTVKRCTRCHDETEKTNYVDEKGHRYLEKVVEPTCEDQGYTLHYCEDCDDHYIDTIVEPLSHDFTDTVYTHEPTCIEEGYSYHKCSRCEAESEHFDIVAKIDHIYEEFVSDATCYKDGVQYYKCKMCGNEKDHENIPFTGHDYYEDVIEPTCETDGYTILKCHNCDYEEKVEYIKHLGHQYETVTIDSTCLEDGYTVDRCARCQKEINHRDYTTERNHHLNKVTVPASCTEDGYTCYKCDLCGFETEHTDVTKALGHILHMTKKAVTPSCTARGCTEEYTCASCGEIVVPSIDLGYGHEYKVTSSADLTCQSGGQVTYYCTKCKTSTQTYVEELGFHHHDSDKDKLCDDCGAHLIYDVQDFRDIKEHLDWDYVIMNDIDLNDGNSVFGVGPQPFAGSITSNIKEGYKITLPSFYNYADPTYSSLALFTHNKGNIHNIIFEISDTRLDQYDSSSSYGSYTYYSNKFNNVRAGIALTNEGIIENCQLIGESNDLINNQYSLNIGGTMAESSTVNYCGMVYQNLSTGIIKDCYVSYKSSITIKNYLKQYYKTYSNVSELNQNDLLKSEAFLNFAGVVFNNNGTIINTSCDIDLDINLDMNRRIYPFEENSNKITGGIGFIEDNVTIEALPFYFENNGTIRNCYYRKLNSKIAITEVENPVSDTRYKKNYIFNIADYEEDGAIDNGFYEVR